MKEYDKAISAAEEASEKDVDKKNAAEIQREMKKIMSAKYTERASETDEQTLARAMKDPEVQKILQDPVMMRKSTSCHGTTSADGLCRNPSTSTNRPIVAAGTSQEPSNTR